MRILFNLMRALMVCLAMLAVTSSVQAASNYWQDVGGIYSGNYTNTAHWSLGSAPLTTDTVFFTNNQSPAYTVTFSASHSNGSLQITSDKIIFNLNGYKWRAFPRSSDVWEHRIAVNAGETATVTFSSSAAPVVTNGNTLDFTDVAYLLLGTRPVPSSATINIDDSLGYPVKLLTPTILEDGGSLLTISGTNSELRTQAGGGQDTLLRNGNIRVLNGALLYTVTAPKIGYDFGALITTLTVSNATLDSAGATIGFYSSGKLELLSNSVWYANRGAEVTVGYDRSSGTEAYNGDLLVDNATLYAQGMLIGRGAAVPGANGRAVIQNEALVILSNGYVMVAAENVYGGNSNTLVLSNATIQLGPAANGAITNRAIMRAAGTITGAGSGNFLLRNEKWLHVGSSLGTLTLNQGDLELAAASENYLEFSDTGLDQIMASNGFANVLGTNIFALASGAPAPLPGVQYGLVNYDFIIATNITYSPQYDNLTDLLGTYGLTNGVHFTYGPVNLGGGLQALRLKFLPPRGTVILIH